MMARSAEAKVSKAASVCSPEHTFKKMAHRLVCFSKLASGDITDTVQCDLTAGFDCRLDHKLREVFALCARPDYSCVALTMM